MTDLDLLYNGRDYAAFGCLFGMRNSAGFRPLTDCCGLPDDVSAQTRHAYEEWRPDGHSPSWLTWAELAQADWEEPAGRAVRMTRRDAIGEDSGWAPVWAVMRALADVHGSENVRLVVWFDS